jgi:cytochrome c oxidase subunit 2
MLDPKGPIAARIADLSWFMITLGGVIYIGVMLYLAYAIWGNRGHDLEEELKRPNQGSNIVVTWGVGFTALVLVVLFGLNIGTMRANNQYSTQEDGLVIDVIGRQWWWEIQYSQEDFETANEIRIPVGQAVTLRLFSKDVIHSLWFPQLGGKLDLLPNQVNEMTVVADQPGEYRGECAEFCGIQHAKMKILLIAQTAEEFVAWLEQQQTVLPPPEGELAQEGLRIFTSTVCAECHTVRGTTAAGDLGPDLTHLTTRRTLGAGIMDYSLGNEAFWIMNSQSIKPGNHMPNIELNDQQLAALMEYISTLK